MAAHSQSGTNIPVVQLIATQEQCVEDEETSQEEFPEGGYGWVVVACVALTNAHTFGFNSAMAIFLAYYLESDAFPGATALEYAFVSSLGFSICLFISPLATASIRKFGTNISFLIGDFFLVIAFVGASFTTKIWHLVLSQGLAFGIGMGFCYTVSNPLTPQWFKRRRAFANGLATCGTGLGGVLYTFATNSIISNLGLAWTFRIYAIIASVVLTICGVLIRDRNRQVGAILISFDWQLFKHIEYWFFLGWTWFSSLGYTILLYSLTDYVRQQGFSAEQATIVTAMFSLSTGIGRPLVGIACDRLGKLNVTAIGTLLPCFASCFLWIFGGKTYAADIIFAFFGVFDSILWAVFAPISATVFGLRLLPAVQSITLVGLLIPNLFGEPIGLSLRQSGSNEYLGCQIFVGVMYLLAFVCVALLRWWKLNSLDKISHKLIVKI